MGRLPRACLLLALAFLTLEAPAADAREVRVGVYDNPPKLLLGKDGQASGILGDLLAEVAREEGWTLRPVACQWETCLAMLEAGDLDLLPDVAHTEERARRFAMHEVPALRSWSQVYTRPGLRLDSVLELDGQRVAVLAIGGNDVVVGPQRVQLADVAPGDGPAQRLFLRGQITCRQLSGEAGGAEQDGIVVTHDQSSQGKGCPGR